MALALAPFPLWFDRARDDSAWASLQSVNIIFKPELDASVFAKETLPPAALTSFDALYTEAMRRFGRAEADLRRLWSMDGEALRAAFLMNLVAGIYRFGAPPAAGMLDCIEGDSEGVVELSERKVLQSSVGCCDDCARVLAALLDRAGIANRFVNIPGHVFNEARLDGAWRAMDATVNILYGRSWTDIVNGATERQFQSGLVPIA